MNPLWTSHRLHARVARRECELAGAVDRGWRRVVADREDVRGAGGEPERLAAPMSANTNRITTGKSDGWALIYCKGPEGEQLEFVQALGPVKKTFEDALSARRRLLAAN